MLARFVLGAVLLGILAVATGVSWPDRPVLKRLAVLGAGLYFVQSYTLYSALERVPAALASILLYSYPVAIAAYSVAVWRKPLARPRIVALVLAISGVILSAGPVAGANPGGIALGIGSAVAYAAYILGIRSMTSSVSPFAANSVVFAATVVPYAGLVLWLRPAPPASMEAWACCVGLAVTTVGAFLAFYAALNRIGAVDASTISSVEPAFTASLAFVTLGERLQPIQLLGGVLCIAAVAVLSREEPQTRAPTARSGTSEAP